MAAVVGAAGSSHSNTLMKDIDQLLSSAQIELRDVDLFAVASGPGSFTGLRIGIATVKALAATLNKSAVGVPTLEAIALASGPSPATVALMPAGRGEWFAQLFKVDHERVVTALDSAAHLSPSRVLERYSSNSNLLWAGPGAIAQRELIQQTNAEGQFAPAVENLAVYCGELALQRYEKHEVEQAAEVKAIYVRPSDAELNTPALQ